ncbi:MAG: PEP-CTERM sorting domain-containing protein [Cyanobacteria bacterium J06635_1]
MSTGDNRSGSSKLGGIAPLVEAVMEPPAQTEDVPEPGVIVGLGLVTAVAAFKRKRLSAATA